MLKTILRRTTLLLVFLVGYFVEVKSQNTSRVNWHFGANNNSIRFARPNLTAELITLPNNLGTGGGAVATDPIKGELLFYTDGINVYNQQDQLINLDALSNPLPLNGSTTRNQGTVICYDPTEADNSKIIIFTVDDAGVMSYSFYDRDLRFNSPVGLPPDGAMELPFNQTADVPAGPLSEGMVIIPNATEDGFWLITHNTGLTTFNVTQIDGSGISTPVPIDIPTAPTTVNNLSYHAATNRIAVAPGAGNENIILLDIDPATGGLVDSGIDLSVFTNPSLSVYDMDWITSGDSLYISCDFGGTVQQLFRVDLTSTPPVDANVDTVLTTDIRNSFGLQYGEDGFLYHLYEANTDGLFKLGRLEDPDTTDITQVQYLSESFTNISTGTSIDFAARQFPSFLPRYNLVESFDFIVSGTCANVPIYFFPQVSPDIDNIQWDFGDMAGTSNAISPIYTYTTGGTYDVSMTVTINGVSNTVMNQIIITDFDITIQLDRTQQFWCPDEIPVRFEATAQGGDANNIQFRWSNQSAADADAVTFLDVGTHYVVATDPATGCQAYLEQQVIEYGTINNFANAWYFGNNAGIDFNPAFDQNDPAFPTIRAITPGYRPEKFLLGNQIDNGPEGYAIYCDQGGRPIVYSNGEEVYNRDNNPVTTTLGGNANATQSVFITQNPVDATIYYIFFTQEVPTGGYQFSYAIFDLKLLNGAGDLVRDAANSVITTTLFDCNSERITGNANWVVVHEFGNNNFRAYPTTALGIGSPMISNVGRIHRLVNNGSPAEGYMKLNGDRLAVAVSESNSQNFIDLFDFDQATGAITANASIDLSPETGTVYGLEFSNENIFATLRNAGGLGTKVFWWDLIDNTVDPSVPLDEAAINASRTLIIEEIGRDFGAMQIGPDGIMYIANEGASNLATISNPDVQPTSDITASTEVNYTLAGLPALGAGSTSRLGLPNFVDFNGSATPQPSLIVTDGCEGESVDITVVNPLNDPDDDIERYAVNIIDPNGRQYGTFPLDEDNTTFSFGQTQVIGVYEVQFFIINDCGLTPPPVNIFNFTINPLPIATIALITPPSDCGLNNGSVTIDISTADIVSYSLSGAVAVPATTILGPANGVIIPNLGAGAYTLNLTSNTTGCQDNFAFIINDPAGFTVTLEEANAADCNNEGGLLSFSFDTTPADYDWEIRTQTTNVFIESGDENTSPAVTVGAGNYVIRVDINDGRGCVIFSSETISSPPLIDISIEPGPFSGCNDEEVRINVTTGGVSPVELREIIDNTILADPVSNFSIIGSNDSIVVTNPVAGSGIFNYALVAPGTITGPCTNFTTLTISFGVSSDSPYPSRVAICPDEVIESRTRTMFDNQPGGFQSVRWFDAGGTEIIQTGADGSTNVAGYSYTVDGDSLITSVTERVTAILTNIEGCITETEINVIEDCRARINAPTAFSPDASQNINDTFYIFPFLVSSEDFEFLIFNRWGEMVFQTTDLEFMSNPDGGGWNGGYDNDPTRPAQGGAYAYKVTFKSSANPERGTEEQRGGVTLIR